MRIWLNGGTEVTITSTIDDEILIEFDGREVALMREEDD